MRNWSGKRLLISGIATDLQFHPDGNEPEPESPLYCMPLSLEFQLQKDNGIIFNGLMLQPTEEQDVYRRVGSTNSSVSKRFDEHDPIFPMFGQLERRSSGEKSFRRDKIDLAIFRIV